MKYLGKEVEVKIATPRIVEYMRCDGCGKKIIPSPGFGSETESEYVEMTTGHRDWGNDSCDSVEVYHYCKKCAAKKASEYILGLRGSAYLELSREVLCKNEKENYNKYSSNISLVEQDKTKE